jgi:hypothetical protein
VLPPWSKVQFRGASPSFRTASIRRRHAIDHDKIHKPDATGRHLLRPRVKKTSDIRLNYQVWTGPEKAQ